MDKDELMEKFAVACGFIAVQKQFEKRALGLGDLAAKFDSGNTGHTAALGALLGGGGMGLYSALKGDDDWGRKALLGSLLGGGAGAAFNLVGPLQRGMREGATAQTPHSGSLSAPAQGWQAVKDNSGTLTGAATGGVVGKRVGDAIADKGVVRDLRLNALNEAEANLDKAEGAWTAEEKAVGADKSRLSTEARVAKDTAERARLTAEKAVEAETARRISTEASARDRYLDAQKNYAKETDPTLKHNARGRLMDAKSRWQAAQLAASNPSYSDSTDTLLRMRYLTEQQLADAEARLNQGPSIDRLNQSKEELARLRGLLDKEVDLTKSLNITNPTQSKPRTYLEQLTDLIRSSPTQGILNLGKDFNAAGARREYIANQPEDVRAKINPRRKTRYGMAGAGAGLGALLGSLLQSGPTQPVEE